MALRKGIGQNAPAVTMCLSQLDLDEVAQHSLDVQIDVAATAAQDALNNAMIADRMNNIVSQLPYRALWHAQRR